MKYVEILYQKLVNENPDITRKYHDYRRKVSGIRRGTAWIYLIKLNIQYWILHRDMEAVTDQFYEKKRLYMQGSESSLSVRKDPESFAEELTKFDVISFDVFDTLIFRPFSSPTDLFYMAGKELNYFDFAETRKQAEQAARKEKYRKSNTSEVSFQEIWDELETETGISAAAGMKTEWECELQYCFGNPYMLRVIEALKKKKKKIIVTSDMYLNERRIKQLLESCGITGVDRIFVSCDYGQSKNEGSLYDTVKACYPGEKEFVHIGDNPYSDYKQAQKHGFHAVLYPNVNTTGMKYRTEDMSVINGSVWRGLVNTWLHNGTAVYPAAYEYGFLYGGWLVLGYCDWIHTYIEEHKIDKILFLSRDGEILSKVYRKLYPDEDSRWEYVYWSRIAAAKMSADHYRLDYFRRFLFHKVNQSYSLQSIFHTMELDDMLDGFLRFAQGAYKETSELKEETAKQVRNYLQEHWQDVLLHYKEQKEAGENYFKHILKGCSSAAAVDVGWAGSGAVILDYLINEEWKLGCPVTGLIAGTNSMNNQEPDISEPMLFSGKLVSYMYSQEHNRDLWKRHNPNKGDNMIIEFLLSSKTPSFRGFTKAKEQFIFCDSKEEIDVEQVQKGILDFTEWYLLRIGKVFPISGRDAYAPVLQLLDNRKWMEQIFKIDQVQMNLE